VAAGRVASLCAGHRSNPSFVDQGGGLQRVAPGLGLHESPGYSPEFVTDCRLELFLRANVTLSKPAEKCRGVFDVVFGHGGDSSVCWLLPRLVRLALREPHLQPRQERGEPRAWRHMHILLQSLGVPAVDEHKLSGRVR